MYKQPYSGFCFGVRRAIDLTIKEVNQNKVVYTFGPLIHNPQEIERLKDIGVKVLPAIDTYIDGTIIIRTHGISPLEYEKLTQKANRIIDGTCPLVKRSHTVTEKLKQEGYRIIIIGDINHPEVVALLGYSGKNTMVVNNKKELEKVPIGGKVGVIAQTTISKEVVEEILSYLTTKVLEVKYYNTLCGITLNQKKSALSLAEQTNIIIVVGGKNSSNTTKLADMCKKVQKKTYLIESAKEIQTEWFHSDDIVGVTAGAS